MICGQKGRFVGRRVDLWAEAWKMCDAGRKAPRGLAAGSARPDEGGGGEQSREEESAAGGAGRHRLIPPTKEAKRNTPK